MLIVRMPANRPAERAYAFETVLGNFLGLAWQSVAEERADITIELEGSRETLLLPDVLLGVTADRWLDDETLPAEPLKTWNAGATYPEARLVSTNIPVIYGCPESTDGNDRESSLPIDVFGSCFFMLTRYEEVVRPVADVHDRFPGSASLAFRQGFLRRPIVNEYVEILWCALKRLWPSLTRKERQGSCFVTCDVDEPYLAASRSLPTMIKQVGGDVLKRRSLEAAAGRLAGYAGRRFGHDRWDAANCFDWMMNVNEKAGNAMAFYFIADKTVPGMDGSAAIDDPFVISLMSRIHQRGHEIGLHGSYGTYLNPDQLRKEYWLLGEAMERAGANQSDIGTRQHYLRWKTPTTAKALADIGARYDTTLGFADMPGFRCGTCYPFRLFDLQTSSILSLWERPLIVMEVSVIADQYLGLGYKNEALELMLELKRVTLDYGGEFILLWHNSHFMTEADRLLYTQVIGAQDPHP